MSDEYRAVNPNQLMPTLIIDGHTLTQSSAILEYLEEARPQTPLLPKNPADRAKVRAICAIIGCDIQPVQNLRVLNRVGEEGKNEWGHHWVTIGFTALEKELTKTAGKYCFGDQITMADIYLAPQVYNATRFGVDVSKFPTIARIDSNLAGVDAFCRGHWSRQPDCPEELRAKD
ncbi:glutathione S-transferase [Thamnocephalis sphaerospora]|uniref:Glutathione S-transferase n=1 Tax=Thamnocephalis sphaerospora TaxID=78915 RepID=A0A4P9XQ15_9FUNG|nr:glutathione S-transferase [Thamnocephalis sphaerospora]|eukprot:RKP08106.1 glutathione S-transferase [Thamnocephalis sphaerospora]